jgi:hypothetical protein
LFTPHRVFTRPAAAWPQFIIALAFALSAGNLLDAQQLGPSADSPAPAADTTAPSSALPQAPSALLIASVPSAPMEFSSSSSDDSSSQQNSQVNITPAPTAGGSSDPKPNPSTGQQPKRILGLMPNYRSVSAGVVPPPPTLQQNFKVATRQAFDYSSFVFLSITTASAYWQDSHPSLDTYNGGNAPFYAYLWRGFLDKTDQTYQSAFILPTLLHEDTRYYAMGSGSKWKRLGYAMSRVAIARTYDGHQTINLAGLGGKAGAQAVSTTYYPAGATSFSVLATKFGYACARDVGFTVFREFYPDIAIHVLHRNP